MDEYAIRVLALYTIYRRMDAIGKIEQINIAASPFAGKEDQGKLRKMYENSARDPRQLLDLDEEGDIMGLKEIFRG
jgi:hypothetical protein